MAADPAEVVDVQCELVEEGVQFRLNGVDKIGNKYCWTNPEGNNLPGARICMVAPCGCRRNITLPEPKPPAATLPKKISTRFACECDKPDEPKPEPVGSSGGQIDSAPRPTAHSRAPETEGSSREQKRPRSPDPPAAPGASTAVRSALQLESGARSAAKP